MVGLVGSVEPSLMSTKYTAAPGADGVGPPVCATAAPVAAKTARCTAPQRTMLYPIRGLVIIPLLALPRSAGAHALCWRLRAPCAVCGSLYAVERRRLPAVQPDRAI